MVISLSRTFGKYFPTIPAESSNSDKDFCTGTLLYARPLPWKSKMQFLCQALSCTFFQALFSQKRDSLPENRISETANSKSTAKRVGFYKSDKYCSWMTAAP